MGFSCFEKIITWYLAIILIFIASWNITAAEKKPQLTFEATFDKYTANADFAKGNGKSSLQASLELRSTAGVKNSALLLDPGEVCKYPVKGNLNMKSATVSMWLKPFNWTWTDQRYVYLFTAGSSKPRFRFQIYVPGASCGGGGVSVYCCFGKRGESSFRHFSVKGNLKWDKDSWHKLDACWNSKEMKLYIDGKLARKIDLPDVDFPAMEKSYFYLVPTWRGKDSSHHSSKDLTIIDEVKIFDGVLSGEQIMENYASDRAKLSGELAKSKVAVPKIDGKIIIDGKLSDPQWHIAAEIPVMINIKSSFPFAVPSKAMLAYDDNNLYVGLSSPLAGRKLIANITENDGKLWEDDSFEVFLYPKGRQNYFQFIVNSKAKIFDQEGGYKKWNGNVKSAAHTGESSWSVELAIPFASLGVETPASGENWNANFCRSWQNPPPKRPDCVSWVECMGGYLKGKGELVFSSGKQAAMLQFKPGLETGNLQMTASANPGSPAECVLKVKSKAKNLDKKIKITPGKTVKIENPLNGFKDALLTVAIKSGGVDLLNYGCRLYVKDPIEVSYIPYVRENQCEFRIDLSNLDESYLKHISGGKVKLKIAATGPDKKTYSAEFTVESVRNDYRMKLPWQDGKYAFAYRISAPGLSPVTTSGSLVKPPTPWLDAKAGITSQVLKPWTALKYLKSGKISFWGRSYKFNGPFPVSMVNQGKEQLASPIKMLLDTNKGKSALLASTEKTVMTKPNRAEFTGAGGFGKLGGKAEWKTFLEYDGLTATRLTLTPPPQGWDVKSLKLVIPLRRNLVKYIRHPKRLKWNGKSWKSGFEPYIWVGTDDEGFDCFFNSDANWLYGKNDKPTEVKVTPDAGFITLNIIMNPVKVTKPLNYLFGFQSTPVKPMMKNWRTVNVHTRPYRGRNTKFGNPHFASQSALFDPVRPEKFEKFCKGEKADNVKVFIYTGALSTPNKNPTFDFFKIKWSNPYGSTFQNISSRKNKLHPGCGPYEYVPVSQASSYTDFLTWQAEQNFKNHSINSIYTDMDRLLPDENAYHGSGYRNDVFGRSGATYDILERRQFYKRLLTICRNAENGIGMGMRTTHAHDTLVLPYHGFSDMFYPGEQYTHFLYKNPFYYIKDLEQETWRVELSGKASGINHIFLPEFIRGTKDKNDYNRPELTESLIAASLLNDIHMSGCWNNREAVEEIWKLKKRTGIDRDEAEFIAYWRKNCPVKSSTPEVKVSVYLLPGKAALIISNFNEKPQTAKLRVNLRKLGLKTPLAAIDERTGMKYSVNNGEFSVPVKGWNYTIVTLKKL